MKIKITQAGSESYTGFLGDVQFFGGVSVGEVSEQSAAGIAAIYAIERIGDDVEEVVVETAEKPVVTETLKTPEVPETVGEVTASIAVEPVPADVPAVADIAKE